MDLRADGSIGENIWSDTVLGGLDPCGRERAHGDSTSCQRSGTGSSLLPRRRELALRLSRRPISTISLKELSMGMSNDYHVAVDEGATMVRLGTAIFGARRA